MLVLKLSHGQALKIENGPTIVFQFSKQDNQIHAVVIDNPKGRVKVTAVKKAEADDIIATHKANRPEKSD